MSKRKQKRKLGKSVEEWLRFLGAHVDGFGSWLRYNGYRPTTIVEVVRLLACWTEWLPAAGFALDLNNILTGFDASALAFKGGRTTRAPRGAAALFIRYLREQGTLPAAPKQPSPAETGPYSGHSRLGCEASAASPTPRSTSIKPRLSIFSRSSAMIQEPLPPSGAGFCS
jgi:integrase/recombinase XerD